MDEFGAAAKETEIGLAAIGAMPPLAVLLTTRITITACERPPAATVTVPKYVPGPMPVESAATMRYGLATVFRVPALGEIVSQFPPELVDTLAE
jgi:hypothetical protein